MFIHGGIYITGAIRGTVCPGSSDPVNIVTYYINWITTFWTYCIIPILLTKVFEFSGHQYDIYNFRPV